MKHGGGGGREVWYGTLYYTIPLIVNMLSIKPGVWYGFQKPALVLANDVIFLATPGLSMDCTKCVQWIECQLSASQRVFLDYEISIEEGFI